MDLRARVLAVHEREAQQPLAAELAQRPDVRADAVLPAAGVGHRCVAALASGREERDALEGAGGQAELRVVGSQSPASACAFVLSSHSRSSPLTLKMSALALAASRPSASEWNSE